MRLILLLFPLLLVACENLPPPVNPEFQEAGSYRNLSTVPGRPQVQIPLGQRMDWQKELEEGNKQAQQDQIAAGLVVPDEAPTPPKELFE